MFVQQGHGYIIDFGGTVVFVGAVFPFEGFEEIITTHGTGVPPGRTARIQAPRSSVPRVTSAAQASLPRSAAGRANSFPSSTSGIQL